MIVYLFMQRNTKQKDAIKNVFLKHTRPLKVQEIKEYGQQHVGSLNQATVYRNLDRLVKEGWLVKIEHPGIGTLFERSGKEHHHHFHCLECDRLLELQGCGFKENDHIPEGFSVKGHELFLFGTCPECGEKR